MAFSYSDIGNLSYIKRITLDLSSGPSHLQIYAKQNDENSRYIEITVMSYGETFTIPTDAIARLRCKKANGKVVYAECAIHDNKVYADLSSVVNTAGTAVADVEFTVVNQILSTQSFIVSTCKAPFEGTEIEDTDDFSALHDALLRLAYLDENGIIVIPEEFINTLMLADGAITTEKIENEAITNGKLADGAVSTRALANDAVTTEKIEDGAVTDAKLSEVYWKIVDMFSVANTTVLDSVVTTVQTIYRLQFISSFPYYDMVGDSVYYGFIDYNGANVHLMGIDTAKRFLYNKSTKNFTEITSELADDAVTDAKIADGAISESKLADGSVTSQKLSDGAIDRLSLFSDDMISKYMSLPVYTHTVSGKIAESLYNTLTDEGIHKVDDATGTHQVVVVLKPTSDAHLMQVRLSYDKLEYRGIWCTEDGVYADEDWEEWTSPIIKVDSELSSESENPLQNKVIYSALENKMNKAELFGLTKALPDTADPQILAYQTYDSTTQNMLRIPLSVLTDRAKMITDAGEYFVSEDVDGALQEIGADINNVEKVCYRDFMDSWGTFSETYERLLSKAANLNGWFCIQRANWDDLPITTCDPVFFNYPYTVNYAIQFLTYWKPGYVYYRIVHRKTFAVYQDWKPIGGTPEPMNILAIGDSICKGNRNSNKGFVGDLLLPYKNVGVSGATISNVVTDYTNIPDQLTGVTDFDPDIIIAEGGINDYFYDATLGTMSEVPVTTDTEAEALDRSTFTGGLEYLFYQMIKLYPKAQRFFVITHKTWKTNESMYCPTTANTQGWTQQDLHDVIVKCCNLYNVKVIDVYNDSMINSLFPEYRSDVAYSTDSSVTNTEYVDYDGVHPLAYGYLQGYVPLIKKALGIGTAK